MSAVTIAIRIDENVLEEIDRWIAAGEFPNRSTVIQQAVAALQKQRARRRSLLNELAKLDPAEERALADERMAAEALWPGYLMRRSC
ncbi:MAG: ribbon-helix-helix domain-containing protein [Dehalococcoidia bacterium]